MNPAIISILLLAIGATTMAFPSKCAANMWWNPNDSKCYCSRGYWWDADQMICVKESDLPEPARDCHAANMHRDFDTGKCVCNGAYIYDESRGGCRKNWEHKCQAPEVWVDMFGACHCPNSPDGVLQVLKNGKCDTLI